MSLFSSAKKTTRQKMRIIQFGSADWGFTDSSMPKVSSLLAKLEDEDVQVWHNGFTLKFRGEKKKEAFERTKALLEESLSLPEFESLDQIVPVRVQDARQVGTDWRITALLGEAN